MIDFNNDKQLATFLGTCAALLLASILYAAVTVSTTWGEYKAAHKARMVEATALCGDPVEVPPVEYANCISDEYKRQQNIEQAKEFSE